MATHPTERASRFNSHRRDQLCSNRDGCPHAILEDRMRDSEERWAFMRRLSANRRVPRAIFGVACSMPRLPASLRNMRPVFAPPSPPTESDIDRGLDWRAHSPLLELQRYGSALMHREDVRSALRAMARPRKGDLERWRGLQSASRARPEARALWGYLGSHVGADPTLLPLCPPSPREGKKPTARSPLGVLAVPYSASKWTTPCTCARRLGVRHVFQGTSLGMGALGRRIDRGPDHRLRGRCMPRPMRVGGPKG